MDRRDFGKVLAGAAALTTSSGIEAGTVAGNPGGNILLPGLPYAAPLPEVVFFAFDAHAFPFRYHLETRLAPGHGAQMVLKHGPEGSHDEVLLYYGTVIRIGDTFHMWYNGNYGPLMNHIGYERVNCCLCYATSKDGVQWEKPNLGLVEFKGSKKNNICDLNEPTLWSTAAVLRDPEDPDPSRRFKVAYEARFPQGNRFCVAFSPDGLRWKRSPRNPVGPFLEMSGVTKFRGLYYVNGQGESNGDSRAGARRLDTFVSDDFEYWSRLSALGLDRSTDLTGSSTAANSAQGEQVHLGAALWNRGNVLVGFYGQWHGPACGDRRFVVLDLGLAVSHDAIHFYEPLPGFPFIPAREQPDSAMGVEPALVQGQGIENVGDLTLYWYAPWRGTEGSGVRMVSWPRDRLGTLRPFSPLAARVVTCPIHLVGGTTKAFLNVSGLGEYDHLRVGLLTEGFREMPGFSGNDSVLITENGFHVPVRWKNGDALPPSKVLRIDVRFEGLRPENSNLHALYLEGAL
jgi:hypothetical protein